MENFGEEIEGVLDFRGCCVFRSPHDNDGFVLVVRNGKVNQIAAFLGDAHGGNAKVCFFIDKGRYQHVEIHVRKLDVFIHHFADGEHDIHVNAGKFAALVKFVWGVKRFGANDERVCSYPILRYRLDDNFAF